MRLIASARKLPVSEEQKEARLRDFIQLDLKAREAVIGDASERCYRLLARSPDSPVACALAGMVTDAQALGIDIQAVFLRPGAVAPASDGSSPFLSPSVTCRKAGDRRLVEAHEQLFLGNGRVWIGDCMRRDPARRDAFESYFEFSEIVASWTERSFQRIWANSLPLDLKRASSAPSARPLPDYTDAPLMAVGEVPTFALPILH
jgi:hypothetical protein